MTHVSLLKNKSFLFLWLSEFFAVLGFSMFLITVSWFVVDELHLQKYLGLVLAASAVPRVILMIFGGILADKIRKSYIMFATNFGQAILLGILLLLYVNDALTFVGLLVLSFFFGALDAFLFPALSSLLPALVKKEQLQRANTLIHSTSELIFVIGPVVAGLLMTYYSFAVTFGSGMVLVFLSALFVYPSFIGDKSPEIVKEKSSITKDFREGMAYVWQSPFHKTSTLIIIVLNLFVMGPLFISFPIIIGEMGGTAFDLSLLESGFSVGSLLATVILLIITLRKKRGKIVLFSLLGTLAIFLVFGQVGSLSMLIVLAFFIGLGSFMVFLPIEVMVQEQTEQSKMGRVMGIITLAAMGFDPIAFALMSLLMATGLSVQTLLVTSACIGAVFALLILIKSKSYRAVQ